MTKIIDLENIDLVSINEKYGATIRSRKPALYTTEKYKRFKKLICDNVKKISIDPPYKIFVEVSCYADIDSFLKPLLDGIELSGVIKNDRYFTELNVKKTNQKRGRPSVLKVFIE